MSETPEEFLDVENVDKEQLRQTIISAMIHYADNRPRSLQKHIGPSQAGTSCPRKLAYALNAEEGPNKYANPLPSMIGTAMHATMEDVMKLQNAESVIAQQRQANVDQQILFGNPALAEKPDLVEVLAALEDENHQLGYTRWYTESKVEHPIPGTCDLFDRDTGTIVDYKFLGAETFGKYAKKYEPPLDYKVQVHLYGAGMVARGFDVKNVAIFMVPRSGRLRDAVLWMEPFDPAIAAGAVERVEAIKAITEKMDVRRNPYRYRLIPAKPTDGNCFFCPHFSPAPSNNPYHCIGTGGKIDEKGNLIESEENS